MFFQARPNRAFLLEEGTMAYPREAMLALRQKKRCRGELP
jgi:hypothetical protein